MAYMTDIDQVGEQIGIHLDVNKYYDLAIQYGTEYGLKIIGALIIFFVGRAVAKGLRDLIEKALTLQNVETTLVHFARSSVYYSLMAVVLLAAIGNLGIQTTSFMAILGAAGLAVGLAGLQLPNEAVGVPGGPAAHDAPHRRRRSLDGGDVPQLRRHHHRPQHRMGEGQRDLPLDEQAWLAAGRAAQLWAVCE